jgi:hypothetical protein
MCKKTQQLVKLIQENPDLEIKFYIDGGLCEDEGMWYVGELKNSKVSDCIIYEDIVYDDIKDVKEIIAEDVVCEDKEMSDEYLDFLIDKEFSKLEVKKVIFAYVSI